MTTDAVVTTPMPELREYQKFGSNWLFQKLRANLYDQQGLGKTPQALDAISKLGAFRVLVHCPKRAIGVWRYEAKIWAPNYRVVEYTGNPLTRNLVWEVLKSSEPIIVISNWAFSEELRLRLDEIQAKWNVLVGDEIHSAGLLNRNSNTFKTMEKTNADAMFLLTGSPTPHGCVDYWPTLHLLEKSRFRSFWKFVNEYAIIERTPFGTNIRRVPREPQRFRDEIVTPYSLRRFKSDVLTELPKKQKQVIKLEMTPKQAKAYREIAKDMLTRADNGEFVLTPNILTRNQRLRQVLVCPRLIGIEDDGAAIDALLSSVYEESSPFAVFTPFRGAAEIIAERLHKIIGSENVYLVTGGMSEDELDFQVRGFQSSESNTKAIVATIASATSWTAHAASYGYFVGFEWSPDANEQAEDRLHRFGQLNPCNYQYFAHTDTIEDRVQEVVDGKFDAHNVIFDRKDLLP